MGLAKPVRALFLAALALWGFVLYVLFVQRGGGILGPSERYVNFERDPNMERESPAWDPYVANGVATGEPEGQLHRSNPRYTPGLEGEETDRISATLLALVRNEEVDGMVSSMKDLERTWNHKFNYRWTFFNDVPFTEEFKRKTRAVTHAETRYEMIPAEHWDMPSWIDETLYEESTDLLLENDVQYAKMTSYHKMCRWNSGLFYKHPALLDTRYYWRVEPNVRFFCDVDYDVFRYMHDNNKTYGFTVTLYDDPNSVPSLWPETEKFLTTHPGYERADANAREWLTDRVRRPDHTRKANGYSTCHFWSNFEVADMEFWRGREYEEYFAHLDRAGGFFYERWGDAPVHSIALGLFEDASRIHWLVFLGFFCFLDEGANGYGQVSGYWIPARAVFQLSEFAKVPWVQGREADGRGGVAAS